MLTYAKSKIRNNNFSFAKDADIDDIIKNGSKRDVESVKDEYKYCFKKNQCEKFLAGYYFAIDNCLNRVATLQRKIITHGPDNYQYGSFENELSKYKTNEYLKSLYQEIFDAESLGDDAVENFQLGYREAELKAVEICKSVTKIAIKNSIEMKTTYPKYWEQLSKELFSMNSKTEIKTVKKIH